MTMVRIFNGAYRGAVVNNEVFELIKPLKDGANGSFITVRPNETIGGDRPSIRVRVEADDIELLDGAPAAKAGKAPKVEETDEQIMDRIEDRFSILEEMTAATASGDVRAMIVVGPPGVGKSFGVVKQLEKASLFDQISKKRAQYEVVKGAMTPIGLYAKLYSFSDPGNVLVFDDCDSILMDDLSLNILKAALDSGRKRTISWSADSSLLRREGIPDKFEFKGSVVFITNLKFDNLKSKKLQDHLEALQSRCHYLDLTMNTMRDRFLRIKQIHVRTGELFRDYKFFDGEGDMVIDFMEANQNRLREMSLRMALKIADLVKISPHRWQRLAETTVMKNSF